MCQRHFGGIEGSRSKPARDWVISRKGAFVFTFQVAQLAGLCYEKATPKESGTRGGMDAPEPSIWFVADFDDPWVLKILGSLAGFPAFRQIQCSDTLPQALLDTHQSPDILILHRSRLTTADAVRLRKWKLDARSNSSPRIILSVGSYVRYAELESWMGLVELVIPEVAAVATLPLHLRRLGANSIDELPAIDRASYCVDVVSSDHQLSAVLNETCESAGFRSWSNERQLCGKSPGVDGAAALSVPDLMVWDVPVLQPNWSVQLAEYSRICPVVALLGFADRTVVSEAWVSRASACLEVPYDRDDLIDVLDRVAISVVSRSMARSAGQPRVESAHRVPPSPVWKVSRGRTRIRERGPSPVVFPWSEIDALPRMSLPDDLDQ
jgi:hypothetical protein